MATATLRFSPSGISRFNVLTQHNKDGTDLFIIIRGASEGTKMRLDLTGAIRQILITQGNMRPTGRWSMANKAGRELVDTKYSWFLGWRPVMVLWDDTLYSPVALCCGRYES